MGTRRGFSQLFIVEPKDVDDLEPLYMVIPCLHDSINEYESINKNISTKLNFCFLVILSRLKMCLITLYLVDFQEFIEFATPLHK